MKNALKGGGVHPDHPLPIQFERARLIKLTKWTEDELDNASAEMCDWILAVDATEREVTDEMQREANR